MANYLYKCENVECQNIFPVEFPFGQNETLVYCRVCRSQARRYITKSVPFVYKADGFVGKIRGEKDA
jgi:predicted nucleic acid-binding Zn ribbon protein